MSAQPPRFSIVIPCFNQGAFLVEALDSLRAQTLPPHEIIVVDDGSTDPYSVQRMDELCVGGVKLIRQENRGLSGARNTGIRAATGDWVLPLDADDCLVPEALASYASAIAGNPEVDVWYPDIQYFGLESGVWECFPFNPWRQLWENQMICSSAIRRTVFEAGVFYNERMRHGYEDWEFYIHACTEHDFRARPLGKPVFRYRKWGYSMLSASDSRRAQLIEQIRRERPIFQEPRRLMEVKRQHNPFLTVATQGPALREALAGQHFQDWRVVDDTDRVARQGELSVFRESRSSFTLVSLADAPLEAALKADPFLLEKVAHTLHQHAPAVVWLVTTEPDAAWPGFLLSEEQARSAPVRCVGFCLSLGTLFHARPSDIPEVSDSFVEDVARHMHELAPHSSLTLVVGPHLTPHEGVALPRAGRAHEAPAPVDPAPAPPPRAPSPRVQLFRLGAFLIGKGMNRLARGALSPQNHERVVQSYLVRGMRARLKGEPPPPRSRHPAAMRPGPLPPSAWKDSRDRSVHAFVLGQPPRFGDALAAEAPALMVVASSLGPGPEGRALRQLLQELAALAPQQRVYLVLAPDKAQRPTLALAREYLAHVAGVFDLPAMARNPGEALAALAERLGVTSVLISDNQTAFEALPALRRLSRRLRIVAHAHRLRVEADPEKSSPCAFVASRFNNLLDGYALTFEDAADTLVKELYVSASKVRVLPLTPESRLAPARRPLLEAGRPAQVVWVQPAAASDERLLLLLDIVRLWRRRHVGQGITFQVAFQGAVASWMPPALRQFKMEDMVSLVANAADPQPLYRDADCLVLPGVTRDATLIAVEAMAAGVPVVAMPEELGASKEWEARLAFALEHPERPLDYVRALELLTDGPEQARARAAQLREALTAQEPRAAALRQLVEWLLPPPPPAWVPQRAAS